MDNTTCMFLLIELAGHWLIVLRCNKGVATPAVKGWHWELDKMPLMYAYVCSHVSIREIKPNSTWMVLDCIVAASPCSQHVAAQVIRFRVLEKSFGNFGTPIFCGELSLKVIFVQFPILDPSPNWVAFNRSHLEFPRCQVEKPLPRYRSCFEATSENQCWDSLPDRLAPYMAILPVDLGVPYFHSNGF